MTTNKQLRELASKATAGPWWIDSHGHRMSANGGLDTVFIADDRMGPAARHPETGNLSHWPNDWDASYIAAANPERVLSLLDEIEALQAKCEKLAGALESVVSYDESAEDDDGNLMFHYSDMMRKVRAVLSDYRRGGDEA